MFRALVTPADQLKASTKKNFLSGRSGEENPQRKIYRHNERQLSIFTPAESDQFQIGTRNRSRSVENDDLARF
jgi:hypothetical protein